MVDASNMAHIPIVEELALIAAVSAVVAMLLGRLRLPTVAGFLLSGALLGPAGFALISDLHAIEVIAEVGVVLLLFTIGLEFSLSRLKHIFRHVALGGILQVAGTTAVVLAVSVAFGSSAAEGTFYGFVVALSSTAIVLRALAKRRELDAPHGRFIVGTLIFQDLCVVPMVLLVPLLGSASDAGDPWVLLSVAMGKAVFVVIAVVAISRLVVPRVLRWVDASGSREVFLLAVLSLCIGTAWLTSLAGLSLALGAFLGGIVVADTEYSHRAMGDMLPLRDVFVSVFFVSLGMFFDVQVLVDHPGLVTLLLVGFIFGKGTLATFSAMLMRFPPRAAWLAGVGLAQFGEFGFVLVRLGISSDVVTSEEVAPLLNAGILSMFLTPLLVELAPHVTAGERVLAPLSRLLRTPVLDEGPQTKGLRDHVIIIGFGLAGGLVAKSLQRLAIEHIGLELNAENVRKARAGNHAVYYADATSEEALEHAHIGEARAVVILINDPQATIRVIGAIQRVAPNVPVLVRTRYLQEAPALVALGATNVVAEELEGGVEVLARLLRALDVPRNLIDECIREVRPSVQLSARSLTVPRSDLGEQRELSALKVESMLVLEGSVATKESPRQLELRTRTGALLVAIRRGGELLPHVDPDEVMRAGDFAYLIGPTDGVERALSFLCAASPSA